MVGGWLRSASTASGRRCGAPERPEASPGVAHNCADTLLALNRHKEAKALGWRGRASRRTRAAGGWYFSSTFS